MSCASITSTRCSTSARVAPKQRQRQRQRVKPAVPPPSCLLCYSVEMTMMDLFSPPGIECDTSIISENCHAESKDEDDDGSDSDDYAYDSCDDNSISSGDSSANDNNVSQDSSVARKICQLWKKKRKQIKAKTLRLRQEAHISQTNELHKRTATATSTKTVRAKTFTMAMQHVPKQSPAPYDERDELQHTLVGGFNRTVSIGRMGF